MTIRGILFDCDGTLVDSETLACEVLVEFAVSYGIEIGLEEALTRYVGGKMADVIADFERRLAGPLPASFPADVRARMGSVFRERLQPIPGAHELLTALRLPVAVASSGPREKIELSLSLTRLAPFFGDRIFSAYEVGVWKPAPDLFLHAARELGLAPEDCLVVEDSQPGLQAARAAGMRALVLGHPAELHGATPIEHLSEVLEHIPATGRAS